MKSKIAIRLYNNLYVQYHVYEKLWKADIQSTRIKHNAIFITILTCIYHCGANT